MAVSAPTIAACTYSICFKQNVPQIIAEPQQIRLFEECRAISGEMLSARQHLRLLSCLVRTQHAHVMVHNLTSFCEMLSIRIVLLLRLLFSYEEKMCQMPK